MFSAKNRGSRSRRRANRRGKNRSLVTARSGSSSQCEVIQYTNLTTQTPFPPRYRTILSCANDGYIATASANVGSFYVNLNYPSTPYSNGAGSSLPNPAVTVTTLWPAGFHNLLYNSTTNSGIYTRGVVYRARLEVTIMPTSTFDALVACIVPVDSSFATFTNVQNAEQAPYAVKKIVCSSSGPSNKLVCDIALPKLQGMQSIRDVKDLSSNYFTQSAVPGTTYKFQVLWQTLNQQVFNNYCGISVRVFYYVEFFEEANAQLYNLTKDLSDVEEDYVAPRNPAPPQPKLVRTNTRL